MLRMPEVASLGLPIEDLLSANPLLNDLVKSDFNYRPQLPIFERHYDVSQWFGRFRSLNNIL